MNILSILLISATILRNVAYWDTEKKQFLYGDIVIEKEKIKGIYPPNKAKVSKDDFLINANKYYLFPAMIDLFVFLNSSAGGNIWVNEFIEETRRQNELALTYFGVSTIGILSIKKETQTDFDIYPLGPWVKIPSSPQFTPYGFEEWNPYVFEIFELKDINDIQELVDTIKTEGALGIIFTLPRSANITESEIRLITELKKQLSLNHLLLFGLTYYPLEEKVLDIIQPDVLIGWLPDSTNSKVQYEMPLFLDTLTTPSRLIPYACRPTLDIYYSFHKVGVRKEAWDTIGMLSEHNLKVIKNRPAGKLLLGSGGGFPKRFFGHATINTLEKFVKAGLNNTEVLKIATINPSLLLRRKIGIIEENEANLILLGTDPTKDITSFKNPIAIFQRGQLILSNKLQYEIDSLALSPLVIGKPLTITDFKKDTTVLGTAWNESYLNFGLEGKWKKNKLIGKKANSPYELWNRGGIISFIGEDTSSWDFSLYDGFRLKVSSANTPCSIYVLSKAAYWSSTSGAYLGPNFNEIFIPFCSTSINHVQGIYIKPLAIGEGNYEIELQELALIEGEQMLPRIIHNLYTRIEKGVDLGDTLILWQINNLIELANKLYSSKDLKYLSAYVIYRLTTILPLKHPLKGRLIDKGLEIVKAGDELEMQILEYALMGLAAGMYPLKAMLWGKRLNQLADRMQKEGKNNPRSYLALGIAKLYTPPMFGGSINKSIEYLEMSKSLFKKQKFSIPYTWGYPDVLVFLAEAYKKANKTTEAMNVLSELKMVAPYYTFGTIKQLQQ